MPQRVRYAALAKLRAAGQAILDFLGRPPASRGHSLPRTGGRAHERGGRSPTCGVRMRYRAEARVSAVPADEVPSPCIKVCVMDEGHGVCIGCLRTLDEIASWSVLDADAKRAVLAAIGERRARLAPANDR